MAVETCRFAPSATGRAHPGTLLAGLICWLDARARGARLVLRLEDLDPERCTAELVTGLQADLAWLGLTWDVVEVQSAHGERHAAALDHLAARGALYPCPLSRSQLQARGERLADGSWAGDPAHRGRPLPAGGWRAASEPLRARIADGLGDPVVRRRDGAVAYQLAVVVDDAAVGVTRVVRGGDLAACTPTQIALAGLLGLTSPTHHHHALLLQADGSGKYAKFHGAVAVPTLMAHYDPRALCGFLAWCAGLQTDDHPVAPAELLPGFSWERLDPIDVAVAWDGARLLRIPR